MKVRKDLRIIPCVVSSRGSEIGKLFGTGAFTSLKIALSIKTVKKNY